MISVVIPVYNAEKYINRCVESVLGQSLKGFELILVDDGSSDNSGRLCDEQSLMDSRIRVFHQKNQGASKARRNGWRMARGEWVTFVDADDSIPVDALENLVSEAGDDTDIVIGWMSTFKTQDKTLYIDEYRKRNIGCYGIDVGPVAHLFRSSLYDDFVFDIPRELTVGEDNLMNIRLAFKTDKPVRIVHKTVYLYDMTNENSAVHVFHQTTDYESLFHKHRLLSIPNDKIKDYEQELLSIRIYRLLCIIKNGYFSRKWVRSDFGRYVRKDILNMKYPLNRANRCLLFSSNFISQCFWIFYSKMVKLYLKERCI